MSPHDHVHTHPHDHDRAHGPDEASGAGGEAWVLRLLLLAVVAASTAAVVTSLSDIRRYLHMRQM